MATAIDDIKLAQRRERDALFDKISAGVGKSDASSAVEDAARRALELLMERHQRQISAWRDEEKARLEMDYKARRQEKLDGESWIGRGAERNALSHRLAQEMRDMRDDWRKHREEDLDWVRASFDRMGAGVASLFDLAHEMGNETGTSEAIEKPEEPDAPEALAPHDRRESPIEVEIVGDPEFLVFVPGTPEQRKAGRAWLIDVCVIPPEIIDYAENAGFLDYGEREVRFIGRDVNGQARSMEIRSIDDPDGSATLMQVRGDAAFPPVLPGDDASTAIVAQGGVNALAIAALSHFAGEAIPAIVSAGRAYAQSWVDAPESLAAQTVRTAENVGVLAGPERATAEASGDEDPEVERLEMILRIARATGRHPDVLYTPRGEDAADYWANGGTDPVSSWDDAPTSPHHDRDADAGGLSARF